MTKPLLAVCLLAACAFAGAADRSMERPSGYVLGADDQVSVHVLDVDEISAQPLRIEMNGTLRLPLAGRMQAAGRTAEQLEADIASRLRAYVKEPQVTVSVVEFRSQPVSVLGAVVNPGVHQLQGRKTLFEILSMAGGLRQDAGHTIKITRRKEWGAVPLAGASDDATGTYSVADVSVRSVMEATSPQQNILVCPNDVISVPRAEMVYVIGAVRRSGGFVLNEREHMTVLQALSLAEGLERTAAAQRSRVLKPAQAAQQRIETPIDLRKIIAGKSPDVPLAAGEILFVPDSVAKSATLRGFEAAVQIGTGVAIWRK